MWLSVGFLIKDMPILSKWVQLKLG